MSDAEKPKLRPANDNPWYCLATLYGEQPAEGGFDEVRADKNRITWNRWMAATLTDHQRADLVSKGFSEEELVPFSVQEKDWFCGAFFARWIEQDYREEATVTLLMKFGNSLRGELDDPAKLAKVIDFTKTHFDRCTVFNSFLFSGCADFSSATFSESADFSSATFLERAYFSSATFSGSAAFGSATFSGSAAFGSATFSGSAVFNSATFSDFANFDSATFSSFATFRSATFPDRAFFLSATFSDAAAFDSATFSGSAVFINAVFTSRAVFAGVRFGSSVPDFRGAKMHEATEWHGVKWPPPPRDEQRAQAQVYAYERLKQEMERLKKHEDEQFFFRKELRARRGLLRRWSVPWLVNYAYGASSDYGQSVVRAIFWLLVVFEFGTAVFALCPVFNGAPMEIPQAAGLSAANIFSFLPIKREIMTAEMVAGLSAAAQFVGAVQSLLGVVLLFLLGLALRNQFRMK